MEEGALQPRLENGVLAKWGARKVFRRELQFEGKVYTEAVEMWVRTACRDIGVMFSMARV